MARRSSEIRRIELTDAALRIIGTRGIAALSTRTLAEEVGLSSGAMFRHFASLEDLLAAVVARVEAVLDSTYPAGGLPPRERLERFVEARTAAVGSQVGIPRLVLSEQFLLALPEGASARLSSCVKKTRAFVMECLREGQEGGVFRDDVAAAALAAIVMGTMQMLALSPGGPQKPAADSALRQGLFTLLHPPLRTRSDIKRTS